MFIKISDDKKVARTKKSIGVEYNIIYNFKTQYSNIKALYAFLKRYNK